MRYNINIVAYATLLLIMSFSETFASVNVSITPDASTLGSLISFVDSAQYENDIEDHPKTFF